MKFVYTILAYVLPTSAVDRAVSVVTKAAAALAAAEQVQNSKALSLDKQINRLSSQRSTALADAARAKRIADRLENLVA